MRLHRRRAEHTRPWTYQMRISTSISLSKRVVEPESCCYSRLNVGTSPYDALLRRLIWTMSHISLRFRIAERRKMETLKLAKSSSLTAILLRSSRVCTTLFYDSGLRLSSAMTNELLKTLLQWQLLFRSSALKLHNPPMTKTVKQKPAKHGAESVGEHLPTRTRAFAAAHRRDTYFLLL